MMTVTGLGAVPVRDSTRPEMLAGSPRVRVPAASVVITNHDHGRYIGQTIESALGQTDVETEAVVVDDGSTDGAQPIIGSFSETVRAVFQPHRGQAVSNLDFAPTIGELLGVPFPGLDGRPIPGVAARVTVAS